MKKPTFKRILAYIIDIFVITIIASALSNMTFLNHNIKKYNDLNEQYLEYFADVNNTENIMDLVNNKEIVDLSYQINYYGIPTLVISLVVTFLYFVVFQYITKGKTLGKLLCGIEIISTKSDKLTFYQLIIRSAIIDSLLVSSLNILLLLYSTKEFYLGYASILQFIDYTLILTSLGMVIFKEDGVGLHDLLSGTKVIFSNKKKEE